MKYFVVACVLAFVACVVAQDPADSWLVYTVAHGGGRITWANASWIVPSYPSEQEGGEAPGWWFGIEPEPAMDLIQPILAWGDEGAEYTIFNGYYQWDDSDWYQSESGVVTPGNHIYAWVSYVAANDSYNMYITCQETGWSVTTNIACEDGKIFQDLYFVVEHQPDDCGQYPANGYIVFDNINMEVEGKPFVANWEGYQYQPACDSNFQIINPNSVKFTWDTSSDKPAKISTLKDKPIKSNKKPSKIRGHNL